MLIKPCGMCEIRRGEKFDHQTLNSELERNVIVSAVAPLVLAFKAFLTCHSDTDETTFGLKDRL